MCRLILLFSFCAVFLAFSSAYASEECGLESLVYPCHIVPRTITIFGVTIKYDSCEEKVGESCTGIKTCQWRTKREGGEPVRECKCQRPKKKKRDAELFDGQSYDEYVEALVE